MIMNLYIFKLLFTSLYSLLVFLFRNCSLIVTRYENNQILKLNSPHSLSRSFPCTRVHTIKCYVLLTNSSKILNILRECITIQKKLERKPIWSPEKHAKYFRLDLDWIWKLRDVNNTAESDSAVSFTPWARKTKKRRRKNLCNVYITPRSQT